MSKAKLRIYRIEAEGDAVYIHADSESRAKNILFDKMGNIPEDLLTITVVSRLPKGEEFL